MFGTSGTRGLVHAAIEAESGSSFEIIDGAIQSFVKDGKQLAPSFVFVDPYGFKLPGGLLRRLLSFPKVELFVNVIWRELDMAITLARGGKQPGMAEALNDVFDGDGWKKIDAPDENDRAGQCAEVFRQMTGARWGTYIRMFDKGRVRYFLLHLTKHEAGRDLMKECVWRACPFGGYYASKSDNPAQQLLIEPEPNLEPLSRWVAAKLADGPKRWQDLTNLLRDELWLEKHLNEVIRSMRKTGEITADGYLGTFAAKNNPRLSLAPKQAAENLLFS